MQRIHARERGSTRCKLQGDEHPEETLHTSAARWRTLYLQVHTTKCQKRGNGGWHLANTWMYDAASMGTRQHCTTCRPKMLHNTLFRAPRATETNGGSEGFGQVIQYAELAGVGITLGANAAAAGCSIM